MYQGNPALLSLVKEPKWLLRRVVKLKVSSDDGDWYELSFLIWDKECYTLSVCVVFLSTRQAQEREISALNFQSNVNSMLLFY